MAIANNCFGRLRAVMPFVSIGAQIGFGHILPNLSSLLYTPMTLSAGYALARSGGDQVRQGGGVRNVLSGAVKCLFGSSLIYGSLNSLSTSAAKAVNEVWQKLFPEEYEKQAFENGKACETAIAKEAFYDHNYCIQSAAANETLAKLNSNGEMATCSLKTGETNLTQNKVEFRPIVAPLMEACWKDAPYEDLIRYNP